MKVDTIEELENALLHLPTSDRSRLATRLIDSLEQEEPEVSDEWLAEIQKRALRLDKGESTAVPASAVWQQVNERFKTAY